MNQLYRIGKLFISLSLYDSTIDELTRNADTPSGEIARIKYVKFSVDFMNKIPPDRSK
jgi:hypothetical protein